MPPEFARAVLALVARIPPGRVSTYGRLAELARSRDTYQQLADEASAALRQETHDG